MSRVIATNEIKEEFDDVLETPLANFPFDFDVSSESVHELQAAQVHSTSTTASNNSSPQMPGENDDQNCSAKSNTPSDDSMNEEEEDEDVPPKNDPEEAKVKVLHLNCTQEDCDGKLDTLDQLHKHLRNKHELAPLQCFCGCKSRFDSSKQMSLHIQDSSSKFSCPMCSKVFSSQRKTYKHWYKYHQTGQFQCNIDHCDKVEDTRKRLYDHQRYHHCPESKRLRCPQDGCSSSFVLSTVLKRHQLTHLNTKPFHCKWPKCVHRTNDCSNLIRHIRNVHFKKQQKYGIVGESDPNKYVRVVNSSKK